MMSICKRCTAETCKTLFTAPCGDSFCAKCIAVYSYIENYQLCKDHYDCEVKPEVNTNEPNDEPHHFNKKLRTENYNQEFINNDFKGTPPEIGNHQNDFQADYEVMIDKQRDAFKELERENVAILEKCRLEMQKSMTELMETKLKEAAKEEREYTQQMIREAATKHQSMASQNSYTKIWKIKNTGQMNPLHKLLDENIFAGRFGYKMRFLLYRARINAVDCQLQVHIVPLSGPWDDILKWPVSYKAKMTFLSRDKDREDYCQEFTSDLERPDCDERQNRGIIHALILLKDLKPHHLVDGITFLKLDIDINTS